MNERVQKAFALREESYNCAQAVIAPLAEALNITEEAAMGFAGALGGGMRVGEVCGAAAGAALAIGLRYGQIYPNDIAAKGQCGLVMGQFMAEFERRMGSLRCEDLLGGKLHDPATAAVAEGNKKIVCPQAIQTALEILEEMGF